MSHVKITLPGPDCMSKGTAVLPDGEDITGELRAASLTINVHEVNRVTLELNIPTVEVDGQMRADISRAQVDLLKHLGWTPPGQRIQVDADGNTHTFGWTNATVTAKVEGALTPKLTMAESDTLRAARVDAEVNFVIKLGKVLLIVVPAGMLIVLIMLHLGWLA